MEIGTAYGFFHSEALKEEIERELPSLKEAGKISNLEVTLIETADLLEFEKDVGSEENPKSLAYFIESSSSNHLDYVLKGTLKGKTNLETARQVSHLLMQMNQSYLNRLGELWGNVLYKEDDGEFVFY